MTISLGIQVEEGERRWFCKHCKRNEVECKMKRDRRPWMLSGRPWMLGAYFASVAKFGGPPECWYASTRGARNAKRGMMILPLRRAEGTHARVRVRVCIMYGWTRIVASEAGIWTQKRREQRKARFSPESERSSRNEKAPHGFPCGAFWFDSASPRSDRELRPRHRNTCRLCRHPRRNWEAEQIQFRHLGWPP